jgi:dTDP-glucose 4,6-dehydratase
VLHVAVAGGDPGTALETNLAGMSRMLDLAASRGAAKFLFTSSGAVYGPQPPDLAQLSEASRLAPDPTRPPSAYGEMKRASELLGVLAAERHGFDFTIARCFAFGGPYLPLDGAFAFGNFIADALRGGPIRVTGDGTTIRSYLHPADLAIWLWWILLRGEGARAYNVGSGQAHSLSEVAGRVASQVPGAAVEIALAAEPGRLADRYVPSVARAEAELGLRSWIGLDDAIRRTLAWHARMALRS